MGTKVMKIIMGTQVMKMIIGTKMMKMMKINEAGAAGDDDGHAPLPRLTCHNNLPVVVEELKYAFEEAAFIHTPRYYEKLVSFLESVKE